MRARKSRGPTFSRPRPNLRLDKRSKAQVQEEFEAEFKATWLKDNPHLDWDSFHYFEK